MTESTDRTLWQLLRSLEEATMLLDSMGRELTNAGEPGRAQPFFDKARQVEKRAKAFHQAALSNQILNGENPGPPSRSNRPQS